MDTLSLPCPVGCAHMCRKIRGGGSVRERRTLYKRMQESRKKSRRSSPSSPNISRFFGKPGSSAPSFDSNEFRITPTHTYQQHLHTFLLQQLPSTAGGLKTLFAESRIATGPLFCQGGVCSVRVCSCKGQILGAREQQRPCRDRLIAVEVRASTPPTRVRLQERAASWERSRAARSEVRARKTVTATSVPTAVDSSSSSSVGCVLLTSSPDSVLTADLDLNKVETGPGALTGAGLVAPSLSLQMSPTCC